MNYRDYLQMEEDSALGQTIMGCVRAIMADWDAKALSDLQRSAYKYTGAGVSVGARLFDNTYVWSGGDRARDPDLLGSIAALCVSSIIEDSDAEVPPEWLDLVELARDDAIGEEIETVAVERFNKIVSDIDNAACALWDEAHADSMVYAGEPCPKCHSQKCRCLT